MCLGALATARPLFTIGKTFSRSEKIFHDREKLILVAHLSYRPTVLAPALRAPSFFYSLILS